MKKSILLAASVLSASLVGCQTTHPDGSTTGLETLYDYVMAGDYKTPGEPVAAAPSDKEESLDNLWNFVMSGKWKTSDVTH